RGRRVPPPAIRRRQAEACRTLWVVDQTPNGLCSLALLIFCPPAEGSIAILTDQKAGKRRIKKRHKALGLIFTALGVLLFAYFVRKAGVGEIYSGIRRLGFGFLIVFALGGLRQAVHAICWVKACEPPYRLRFIDAFKARLMGESLN